MIANPNELEKVINSCINKAVTLTIDEATTQLTQHIQSDYYDQYVPIFYERTNQFLNSVAYEMLNGNEGVIYIDESKMNYRTHSSSYVLDLASKGYHGNLTIATSVSFWYNYLQWCNANLIPILINNLRSQGLQI